MNQNEKIFSNPEPNIEDNPAEWNDESELNSTEICEILSKLPSEFHDFSSVFSKTQADILPDHRKFDMEINIVPDQKIPWGPIYPLSEPELQTLKSYLDEQLQKGFI